MKRKILAAALVLGMCFTFAGCGGGGKDNGKTSDKEKAKETTIIGSWECGDIEVTDNGKKMKKDSVKTIFGEDFSKVLKFSAYSDGTAYITMMDDENGAAWTKTKDKSYKISLSGAQEKEGESMTAKLDGKKLIIRSEDTYQSDGKDMTMEMEFIMKYLGKKSRVMDGWDVTLSDDEVYAMSNFVAEGRFVATDGLLYGDYGGKKWGKGAFTVGKINGSKVENQKVLAKDAKASGLTVYDGAVYGILDQEKIIKAEVGKTKVETLYTGTCEYLQVTKDGIFFTDEKNHYCRIDFDGKNKKTILEKKTFFPYRVSSKFLIYQDDEDGETLHVYNLKNGKDKKISDVKSYGPMLCGDFLYFYTPGSGEDMKYICRIDMYSGRQDKAEKDAFLYDFYVTPKNLVGAPGGFVFAKFSEWDKFAEKNSAGFKFYPMYSDGEIWITKSSGENFMGPRQFGSDDEKSIGYSYVKKK